MLKFLVVERNKEVVLNVLKDYLLIDIKVGRVLEVVLGSGIYVVLFA